jgi:hypothetical protein
MSTNRDKIFAQKKTYLARMKHTEANKNLTVAN